MSSVRTGWLQREIAFLLLCSCAAIAQMCPHGEVDHQRVIDLVKNPESADVIYRAAAIEQERIIPILKQLSKPSMSADTVPGAAQVSLARLGDKFSLSELQTEINSQHAGNSIQKLLRTGTDEAISVLMTYLQAHVGDTSLARKYGDYTIDIRLSIVQGLGRIIPDPPTDSRGVIDSSYQHWLEWWDHNKHRQVTLSINKQLNSFYLQCLARKVEWGFPDAILDMANTGDIRVIPVLRILTHVGDQAFTLNTISGLARFGLAKLGDHDEFNAIVHGLDSSGYRASIEELRLIGGKKAITALIDAFDSEQFLPEHKGYGKIYLQEISERDRELARALAKMIVLPAGVHLASKEQWKQWWAENKDTAKLAPPVQRSYE